MSSPPPSSLVHERQSLQLCAIHTINNLLQISGENDAEWMCGSHKLKQQPDWTLLATKAELDAISDQLTIQESNLLVEGEGNDSFTTTPSFYQKLRSQHRTMVFGRYSFEVRCVYRMYR